MLILDKLLHYFIRGLAAIQESYEVNECSVNFNFIKFKMLR